MMSQHRCKLTRGKLYLGYFDGGDPFLVREDGFTTRVSDFLYTVKELKDGTFIVPRDIRKEDYQFRQKECEGVTRQRPTITTK